MKLLVVLCLGTLAFSAPAPQKGNQIDFLFDDDETQASVRPVELSTVEPKVTASKISDPRRPAPVFEEAEEEEADVQEKEPSPIASPLNLEQSESDTGDPSTQFDETDDNDLENGNKTESSVTDSSDSAVTDTTIRVYDEDEVIRTTEKEERPEQDQENERDQQHEKDQEHEQDQDQDQKQDQNQEQEQEQRAVIDDSYQYDDESFEAENRHQEGLQKSTTAAPEPNPTTPAIHGNLNVELDHEPQVVENGNFGNQDLKTTVTVPVKSENRDYLALVNMDSERLVADTDDDFNVELKGGQLFNHGTLVLEKGTFEGQDINHPFTGPFPTKPSKMGEKPDFAGFPHGPFGPHGPHGHRGHPNFPGTPNEHHRFEGPPPPWVQGHHFHPHHFDHKSHDHKGYPFRDNGFHRNFPAWNGRWENLNSGPPTNGSPTDSVYLSE